MSEADPGRRWLLGSRKALGEAYDVLLLDLDGTVYRGRQLVPGAAGVIAALRGGGNHPVFVTNNAARTPQQVAAHLVSLGVACAAEEVATSAQAAAAELTTIVPRGARVLVVGGDGLRQALQQVGLDPVDTAEDVAAVVQGWAPDLAWPLLAEGAFALAAGMPWVVANTDLTLPTERGTAPGNGSFVALLSSVTGRQPDRVAGKPAPPLLRQAAARFPGVSPLVVGDRLDTDVSGATAVALPSLLVLSGVTGVAELLSASADRRPTFLSYDLSGLIRRHEPAVAVEGGWRCGSARASVTADGALEVSVAESAAQADLDVVRAACAAAWAAADAGRGWTLDDELRERLAAAAGPPTP